MGEVTHSFVSAVADDVDTDLVRPSDWNADHDVTLTAADVGAAPDSVDYLVGTASGGLSGEIAVGTSPGGELGGTWASPTVDATHSGSAHVQIAGDLAGTAASPIVAKASSGFTVGAVITPSLSVDTNDWSPTDLATATIIRVDVTGTVNLTGIDATGVANGRLLIIRNIGSGTLVLVNNSGSSTSTNRLVPTPSGVDVSLGTDRSAILYYDFSRWRVLRLVDQGSVAGANDTIDGAASAGTSTTQQARVDHGHRVNTSTSTPLIAGAAASGTSGTITRGAHVHPGGSSDKFVLTGEETSTLTGSNNDVALAGSTTGFWWNGAADATFTGIGGTNTDGRVLIIANKTAAKNLTLTHNDTNSAAAARFFLPQGASYVIGPRTAVALYYETTGAKWYVLGTPVDTAAGANDTIDAAGVAGTSGYAAASGHGHRLDTYASNPAAIGTASAGTSTTAPSRGDHVHPTSGAVDFSSSFALSNDETSTLTGAQDNVTLAAGTTVFRWNGASASTFTGLTGGADGRIVILENVTTGQNLTLSHDVTSTAGNRFFLPNSVTMTVLPNEYVVLLYDATSSRWRVNGEPVDTAAGANVTLDGAGTTGTAGYAAASGHGHRLNTYSSAGAAIGTAAAGTSGTAPSRGDHVHSTGAGTPSTQAMGDAAATGTGPAAAMTDHKHAMPARGYGLADNATPAVSLTTAEAFVTATTSISAATYADITGASISLVAGTWLILAHAVYSMVTTTAGMLHLAITHSDNTIITEGSQGVPAGTATVAQNGTVSLSAIVTPGSTTTYKLRGARGTTTYTSTVVVMDGTGVNTANNTTNNSDKGTSIRAVRIA